MRFKEKGPWPEGWQQMRLTLDELPTYFGTSEQQNIGGLLGEPYADVDLDSIEALRAWIEFSLETFMVFGRKSKPASHHFYEPDPPLKSTRYLDPCATKEDKACLLELRALKSNGEVGLQTILPPSTHPSGERVEFVRGLLGEPAKVDGSELQRATDFTAACALLGRYAPTEGARHDFFLALAGGLAHAKWELAQSVHVVRAIYRVLWGHKADLDKATKEVESTYQRYDDGGETTGLPHLKNILKPKVFARALEWLGLGAPKPTRTVKTPKVYAMNEALTIPIPRPELLIEDLLPRKGASMLYGMQKSGKTILAMQVGIAVATGTALFGSDQIRSPGGVLILQQDDPDGLASFQQIIEAGRVPAAAPIFFVPKQDCFYIGPDMMTWLEDQIKTNSLRLVILDSYTALRSPRPQGVDIVKHENSEITLLDELGKRTDCLILLLHHASKSSSTLDWASKGGGTFAMTMAIESQVLIERYAELAIDARERLVRLQGRHLPSRELTLRFLPETLNYELLVNGAGASHFPLILEIYSEFGDQRCFNAKLLSQTLGISRATAFRHLAALRRGGVLVKTGSGDYLIDFDLSQRIKGGRPCPTPGT